MSIEIIRCSVRRLKQQSQIKNNLWQLITLYLFNMTQQCAVAGLPRETNDGCFDAANANKSCVQVHEGQSSEFPIYPTTRERGIVTHSATRTFVPPIRQNRSIRHSTGSNQWATRRIFCTPSSPVHTFMAEKTCQKRFF